MSLFRNMEWIRILIEAHYTSRIALKEVVAIWVSQCMEWLDNELYRKLNGNIIITHRFDIYTYIFLI